MKKLPFLSVSVQHPNLKPRLRDYQKKAVIWMLTKERFQSLAADEVPSKGLILCDIQCDCMCVIQLWSDVLKGFCLDRMITI